MLRTRIHTSVLALLLLSGPALAAELPPARESGAADLTREAADAEAHGPRLPFEERVRRLPPGLRRRLRQAWQRMAPGAEAGILRAEKRLPESLRPHLQAWRELATDGGQRRAVLLCCAALGLLLVLVRLGRRPGDLVVVLEYPAELRGTFSIQLAKRKRSLGRPYPGKTSTRSVHHLVARESCFRGVRPGRYWIAVDGVLADLASQQEVKRPYLTQCVSVYSRQTARAELDLRPQGTTVTVTLLWDGRPLTKASVSVAGVPESVRYARNGVAHVEVAPGTHRILAGSGDRVAECEVRVTGSQPVAVEIDLAGRENVVFRGCPAAVDPYLRGDLTAAARALEREGHDEISHLLKARLNEQGGRTERAAMLYRKAGDSRNAIRLLEEVPSDDSGYRDACEMLADAFEAEGELEQAVAKLQEALDLAPAGGRAELYLRLAKLLERSAELTGAIVVLETLKSEEPDHPDVDARVEEIRKLRRSGGGSTVPRVMPAAAGADDRYEILEQVGAGGMGVVYRALDRRLGREVALKKLAPAVVENPAIVELFLREARAAAALNHPNIVTLFDADGEDGEFFITMELLAGNPLSRLLRRYGRLGIRDTILMGRQIVAGLAYAHERRIVHRDIKPANLFYTTDRMVKIMDFGLAKMIEEVRRSTTVLGGTPYYMAPEQSAGGIVDTRADLYALGVTFFELLTGHVPFSDGDVAYEHRHTEPPDPRDDVPELPGDLTVLVLQLLAKEPEERPDALQVGSRLEALS